MRWLLLAICVAACKRDTGETMSRGHARMLALLRDVRDSTPDDKIYKHVNSGGTFETNPLAQTIGIGKATRIERVEVYWPTTGKTQALRDVAADGRIVVTEAE